MEGPKRYCLNLAHLAEACIVVAACAGLMSEHAGGDGEVMRMLSTLRILRIFRIVRLLRAFKELRMFLFLITVAQSTYPSEIRA